MNISEAKSIRLDDFLENLGYVCAKETPAGKWYKSPFRDERTASFKLTRDGMAFYDHAEGRGGNIIDLAKRLGETENVSEALKFIENTVGSGYSFQVRQTLPVQPAEPYYSIVYDAEFSIYKGRYMSQAALYLKERRGISPEAFYPYLRDVFHVSKPEQKKPFYAFGLPNIAGGFETRTFFHGAWHKRTIGQKDITAFKADSYHAPWFCFYSIMDFGTFLTVDKPPRGAYSYLIINGDGLVSKAEDFIASLYAGGTMFHYPHNDQSGQKAYHRILDALTDRGWGGGDRAFTYEGFKDLTEKREKELGLDKHLPMPSTPRIGHAPKYRP